MRSHPNLEKIEQVVLSLPLQEQLELMEKLVNKLKKQMLRVGLRNSRVI